MPIGVARSSLKGIQALLLVLGIATICVTSAAAQDKVEHKKVLILFSHDAYRSGQILVEGAIRSTLKDGSIVPVDIYPEYMDDAQTAASGYEKELVALLRRKYQNRKFDAIFAVSEPALPILLRNRSELFPNTPIVFLTLDQRTHAGLNLGPNITGVWGEVDFKQNLELALGLHPGAKQVVVISGLSEWDKYWKTLAQTDFSAYRSSLKFTYLTGLTSGELEQSLAVLPPQTIVVYITSVLDRAGNTYESQELLQKVSPKSSAPIYGTTDSQIGFGAVGGSLLSFEALGVAAAQVGLRVLAGEKPDAIAPRGVPNASIFDWNELNRWGISESRLPPESKVRNRTPTLWDEYKWHIITLVSLTIVQSVLIAALLINRSRRKRAEVERARFASLAETERRHLAEVISNLPGIVWEGHRDEVTKELRTTFVSDYLQKMIGYTPEEWLKQPSNLEFQIMLEEDREKVKLAIEAVMSNGRDGFTEFRWAAKDNRIVWVESYLSPIIGENGRVDGVRGVILDVSGRKETEEALRATEERSSAIVAAIPDVIFLQTSDGVFLDYHAEDKADLPATTEELLGKSMYEVLPPELAADFERSFQLAAQEHGPQILEYKLGEKWFEARIIRTGDKFLSVVRDITDRREAESALHQANLELSKLKNQLEAENIYLQEELREDAAFGSIIGQSAPIKYVLYKVSQVAALDSTVLILGETGTGKELVARAIHGASLRKDRPLIKVNCAALSPTLIESELFGHEKGAFTGAATLKMGRFELANSGTLLLDEIGELPMDLQGKLLRVLQEGEFERVGSGKTIKVDVRIIASTNRNLKLEVERGRFREDLWYRLNVFPITTPPLRDRRDDIPALTEHFARSFARKFGKQITEVSPHTIAELCRYGWPGNIRELANVIERAVINSRGPVLEVREDFPKPEAGVLAGSVKTLEQMEREHIIRVLEDLRWRIEGPMGAARVLGINPSTLRTRMGKLGIQKPTEKSSPIPR